MQYFHNNAFDQVVRVIKHTGLWDAELAWYSPNATIQYYTYLALPGCQGPCNPEWNFLNHLVSVISCIMTIYTANVFCCFHDILDYFELVSPNYTLLYKLVWLSNYTQLDLLKSHYICSTNTYKNSVKLLTHFSIWSFDENRRRNNWKREEKIPQN